MPDPIRLDLASTPKLLDFSTPRLFVFIDIPGSFVEFLHFSPVTGSESAWLAFAGLKRGAKPCRLWAEGRVSPALRSTEPVGHQIPA